MNKKSKKDILLNILYRYSALLVVVFSILGVSTLLCGYYFQVLVLFIFALFFLAFVLGLFAYILLYPNLMRFKEPKKILKHHHEKKNHSKNKENNKVKKEITTPLVTAKEVKEEKSTEAKVNTKKVNQPKKKDEVDSKTNVQHKNKVNKSWESDENYQKVKAYVLTQQYMTMAKIQKECSVGFNYAGRCFHYLQDQGIISSSLEGNKGYKVLKRKDGKK